MTIYITLKCISHLRHKFIFCFTLLVRVFGTVLNTQWLWAWPLAYCYSVCLFMKELFFTLSYFNLFFCWSFYYHFTLLRVFHTSVSWWLFAGVWVTASLLKSLGLFSVFWSILIIVSTRPLISMSTNPCAKPLVTVPLAPITNGFTITFMFHSFSSVLLQDLSIYLSFRFLLVLPCGQSERQSPQFGRFSFFVVDYH